MSNYFKVFPKTVYDNRLVTDITRKAKIMELLATDPYAILPYTVKEDERPEDVAYYYYGDQDKVWLVYLANNIIDPYSQWPMNDDNLYQTLLKKYASSTMSFSSSNVNVTNNTITLSMHKLSNTDPVIYTKGLASTLPLSSSNTYYVIFVDQNTIKLASSAANAIAGTALDLTTAGDGTIERNVPVYLTSTAITSNVSYAYHVNNSDLKINLDTYLYGGVNINDWNVVRVYDYEIEKNEDWRHIYLINKNYAMQLQNDLKKVINV